jgi:hypothetical protein
VGDRDVLESIQELAHEEHELRGREGRGELDDEGLARLQSLEARLDQCWDLLRQRRARRSAGEDPDEASVRDVNTVEHYRQ